MLKKKDKRMKVNFDQSEECDGSAAREAILFATPPWEQNTLLLD